MHWTQRIIILLFIRIGEWERQQSQSSVMECRPLLYYTDQPCVGRESHIHTYLIATEPLWANCSKIPCI